MRTTRPDDDEAGRVVEPTIPDERQGWGGDGYVGGEPVPTADAHGWGSNGFAGTEPGRLAEAELTEDPSAAGDPATDVAAGSGDPADDDGPGPHPASVLAGR